MALGLGVKIGLGILSLGGVGLSGWGVSEYIKRNPQNQEESKVAGSQGNASGAIASPGAGVAGSVGK